jgi:hypothetical protein
MTFSLKFLLLICAFALFVRPCSAAPSPADEIKAVIRKVERAIVANSEKDYIACFVGPKGVEDFLKVGLKYRLAINRFEDSLVKEYGPHAREKFDALKVDSGFEPQGEPRDEHWIDELEIKIEGDTASFIDPATGNIAKASKIGQEWKLSLDDVDDVPKATALYTKMVEIVEDAAREIDSGKLDLKAIKEKMGKRFWDAVKPKN